MLEINETQGSPWVTLKYLFELPVSVLKAEDSGALRPRQARGRSSWETPLGLLPAGRARWAGDGRSWSLSSTAPFCHPPPRHAPPCGAPQVLLSLPSKGDLELTP